MAEEPIFFAGPAELRAWLEANYDREKELWVGAYKKAAGQPTVTYDQIVEEALCFGWIDGVRKSVDQDRWKIRLSPRKPRSIWSQVNLKRMQELIAAGRVHPHGLQVYESRDPSRTNLYSSEQQDLALSPEYETQFQQHPEAWAYFQSQPPSYRNPATWWVMSAKQEPTRLRRLATLIDCSTQARRVPPLTSPSRRS
jgi:uncharacterized protein YdeI (YjbR/CyaY-like superfamily)